MKWTRRSVHRPRATAAVPPAAPPTTPPAGVPTSATRSRGARLPVAIGVALAVVVSPLALASSAIAQPAAPVAATVRPAAEAAPAAGEIVSRTMTSEAVGELSYSLYLPPGYDPSGDTRYPTLYLLHGRGDTQAAWQQIAPDLDAMIADGSVPPVIAIMPDAPWSNRGGYYVDSAYTGSAGAGAAIETAFTTDLLGEIDATLPTITDRAARVVGGYSMGGAGAIRYLTAHQDLFAQAIVLSPAVYVPTPPADSSAREFGAFGSGDALFDEDRYLSLNYPATFAALDPALPVHAFIAVGDDEWVNPLPEDSTHDLDYEAATLYNSAKRVQGITAEFRVYNGGHGWDVWRPGVIEGMRDVAKSLQTAPVDPWEGTQIGSAGDDRAGGVISTSDGAVVQVINAAGDIDGHTGAGGFDIVVRKQSAAGELVWQSELATPLAERGYGIVDSGDGSGNLIVGGYARTDHAEGQNDDAIAIAFSSTGDELWRTAFGSPSSADRAYAIASDGKGGAYLAGYTSGTLPGQSSAGDKDAMLARIDATGAVLWATQFGGTGEDKAYAVVLAPDGGAYLAGGSYGAMPGATSFGGADGWIAKFTADGERSWLRQIGTSETDQIQALSVVSGGVVAAGFTGGQLGEGASSGDKDAFVARLSEGGDVERITQFGTTGDDRAAAILPGAEGGLLVVGHTSGRFTTSAGGVDVFLAELDAKDAVVGISQVGSPQRDGADEYDEANLFVAGAAGGKSLVQGLTAGAVAGAVNAGAGDVFLMTTAFDPLRPDGAVVTPPIGPGTPGGPGLPGAAGPLSETGFDAVRLAALALLLLGAGAVIAARRRRALVTPH